jgi:hypothetical protein
MAYSRILAREEPLLFLKKQNVLIRQSIQALRQLKACLLPLFDKRFVRKFRRRRRTDGQGLLVEINHRDAPARL